MLYNSLFLFLGGKINHLRNTRLTTHKAVCLLEQGKYNRIVGMKGEKLVDYPVDEALEMTKTLDPVLIDVCNTISI